MVFQAKQASHLAAPGGGGEGDGRGINMSLDLAAPWGVNRNQCHVEFRPRRLVMPSLGTEIL